MIGSGFGRWAVYTIAAVALVVLAGVAAAVWWAAAGPVADVH